MKLTQQKRGKGKSQTFLSVGHRSIGKLRLHPISEVDVSGKMEGKVLDIVKDPIHYAPIAIIEYEDGYKSLVPAAEGMYVGQKVYYGADAPIETGNVLPLRAIPEGTKVYMIENNPGDGGKFVRASGGYAILMQKTDKYAILRFPSKQTKAININSRAIIGVIAGGGRKEKPFVKAGNKYYWMRARNRYYPYVSATARNACDHPFGGKHKRNKGKVKPLPKKGYPIKYGYYGSRRTGRRKK